MLCLRAGTVKRRTRAAPAPPPPPPPPPDTPRKAHNPLATAEAIQAVDAIRQQQRMLSKKVVYAPFEASVAIKVRFWPWSTIFLEMGAWISVICTVTPVAFSGEVPCCAAAVAYSN